MLLKQRRNKRSITFLTTDYTEAAMRISREGAKGKKEEYPQIAQMLGLKQRAILIFL